MWLDKLFLKINNLNVKTEYEIYPFYFSAFIAVPLKVCNTTFMTVRIFSTEFYTVGHLEL